MLRTTLPCIILNPRAMLALLAIWLFGQTAAGAPRADLWPLWLTHAEQPSIQPQHQDWQRFLDTRLRTGSDGINRLDYAGVSDLQGQSLTAYLDRMQALPVSRLTRAQQLAYWINLYNAGTVSVILAHYPVDSIRDIDISPGWFSDGPWGRKLFRIEGQQVSLDDIEHRILRPIWRDPRLHYALNCAALGCPNLQPSAFTAANTESLLEQGARDYVNHPRGVRLSNGRLRVSSIYHWFKQDFGTTDDAVIRHLKQYAAPELQSRLQAVPDIDGHDYDWSLNAAR